MTIITFVLPWYGPDLPGGAEAEARRTIQNLQQAGVEVEVFTTCTRDLYADWGKNYHQPGTTTISGTTVHRYPVEPRDRQAFDRINGRLMHNLPIGAGDAQVFLEQMIRSPRLIEAIQVQAADRLYVFMPYMFSTTYYGVLAAPDRALMIPCLHDEAYARLPIYQDMFAAARSLMFYTEAEKQLAARLYPPHANQLRAVLGGGVDNDRIADGDRFRRKYGLDGPLILYAGRREAGKNTPLLLDYWSRYWREEGQQRGARLVLLGSGDVAIPPEAAAGIIDLGFVSVEDKTDAYAAVDIFCMPSIHESFSIVLMESWLAGTPVLVHADCAVTLEHVVRSNGGLYFASYDEFAATISYLLDNPATAAHLGQQGRAYVLANYPWDIIIPRYRALFHEVLGT